MRLFCSEQGVFLDHNDSQRYESRFATVKVADSRSIMFKGMQDTTFGMWVSHGEGNYLFPILKVVAFASRFQNWSVIISRLQAWVLRFHSRTPVYILIT